jgi:hypothetical protein
VQAVAVLAAAVAFHLPAWASEQVTLFSTGLGEWNPKIVRVRMNVREHGRLVDHIWLRGRFSCGICTPQYHTRAELVLDVHTRHIFAEHITN